MLLGNNFLVLDGLNGSVVVVLMDLLVDGSGHILMLGAVHVLVSNAGSNLLMNRGVMVTSLAPVSFVSISCQRAWTGKVPYMNSLTADLASEVMMKVCMRMYAL